MSDQKRKDQDKDERLPFDEVVRKLVKAPPKHKKKDKKD